MQTETKTSTFVIHHDRCDPACWAPADILALANFVSTGDLRHAAHLSRLGMQLVLSEHHEPKGGDMEAIGYMPTETDGCYLRNDIGDIEDVVDDDDVFRIYPVFRGHMQYAVRIGIGDHEGDFEGYEYERFNNEGRAVELLKSLQQETTDG